MPALAVKPKLASGQKTSFDADRIIAVASLVADLPQERSAANDELASDQNVYTYVNNNPINYTDPTGTQAFNNSLTYLNTYNTNYYGTSTASASGVGYLSSGSQSLASLTASTIASGAGASVGNLIPDTINGGAAWMEQFTHSDPGSFGRVDPWVNVLNPVAQGVAGDLRGVIGVGLAMTPIKFGAASSIVIGEDMAGRVIPTAESRGAGWYNPPDAPPAQWMQNNQNWINQQMNSRCMILDCGAAPGRTNFPNATSPYYQMELDQIQQRGYQFYKKIPAVGE
jgi:hypothetical protein